MFAEKAFWTGAPKKFKPISYPNIIFFLLVLSYSANTHPISCMLQLFEQFRSFLDRVPVQFVACMLGSFVNRRPTTTALCPSCMLVYRFLLNPLNIRIIRYSLDIFTINPTVRALKSAPPRRILTLVLVFNGGKHAAIPKIGWIIPNHSFHCILQ